MIAGTGTAGKFGRLSRALGGTCAAARIGLVCVAMSFVRFYFLVFFPVVELLSLLVLPDEPEVGGS